MSWHKKKKKLLDGVYTFSQMKIFAHSETKSDFSGIFVLQKVVASLSKVWSILVGK